MYAQQMALPLLGLLLAGCVTSTPRYHTGVVEYFPFDAKTAVTEADRALSKYFTADSYRKKNYDRHNAWVGSFIGKDCGNNPLKLVFVAYRASDPNEYLLSAVLRSTEGDTFQLEAEGPGLSKDIAGLMFMFQNPHESGQCHENE